MKERLSRKQHSYAKLIIFWPSSENCSLPHNLRGTKAVWRLLRITVNGVVARTSLQKHVRLTGLTWRTAFLYEMLYE